MQARAQLRLLALLPPRLLARRARLLGLESWLILRHAPTELLELYVGLYSFLYGAWIANPGTDSFSASPSFRVIAEYVTEPQFGTLIMAIGALKLLGMITAEQSIRRLGSFTGVVFWAFMVMLIGVASNWQAAGLPHFALAAVGNMWIYLRRSWSRG